MRCAASSFRMAGISADKGRMGTGILVHWHSSVIVKRINLMTTRLRLTTENLRLTTIKFFPVSRFALGYSEVLYSQAVRQGSQYIRPSEQMRTSKTPWQRQQNFSQSQLSSGFSHCAQ